MLAPSSPRPATTAATRRWKTWPASSVDRLFHDRHGLDRREHHGPVDALSKARAAACQALVSQVRRILPSDRDEHGQPFYDFKLLNAGGKRNFDTGAIIQRHDQRIAMRMLADFILLGQDRVGSFALSSSKTALFAASLGAYLDHIADVFNRYAIPRLMEINGEPLDDLPELEHGDIESPDLGELGSYVQALTGAQVALIDKATVDYLRTAAGLPESEEGEQRAITASGEAKPDQAGAAPAKPAQPAAARPTPPAAKDP